MSPVSEEEGKAIFKWTAVQAEGGEEAEAGMEAGDASGSAAGDASGSA